MKEKVLGIQVNTEKYDRLIQEIFSRIERKEKTLIVAINPEKIMNAKYNETLKKLLNDAEIQIPDGIGVIIASKIQKGKINERVTGVEMMMRICEEASNKDKSIFLYGGKCGVADKAAKKLKELYPSIKIVGTQDGYENNMGKVISNINAVKPDILFVAMGSPKQENWINQYRNQLYPTIFQGVGGSFDVLAGTVKRAPAIFQHLGLEWFYRLLKEPKRFKRQLALPRFLVEVVRHSVRKQHKI